MANDDLPINEEQYESIPWSSLVAQTNDRPWLVYVAAGAVVALVLGLLVARSFGSNAAAFAPAVPPSSVVAQPSPSTTVLSEADLRAEVEPGDDGERAAIVRAEWFVTDYFTSDAAGGRSAEVTGALGRPAPETEPAITTYVEWARAWRADHEGDGRFRVAVAFRSITGTEAGFERGLVHAVAVRVQVDPNGGTRVLDLPEPLALPDAPIPAERPEPQPVPEALALEAFEQTAMWGDPVEVLEGFNEAGRWRIHVTVSDDHGAAWPLVVWLKGETSQGAAGDP